MLSKKYALVTLLPLISAAFAASPVLADDTAAPPITVKGGTVQFTGSIVNTPCVIDNDSASQTVQLGQYRANAFTETGSTSAPVGFSINLSDCAVDTYSKASVTFTGITVVGNKEVLAPLATQAGSTTAGGVGIQLLQDSKPLAVDGSQASDAKPFTEAGGRLNFQAQYVSVEKEVTPGSANATADFTVTYQ